MQPMTSDSVIAPDADLVQGTLLAERYRLAGRLASGGMGAVHRGWDERLARPVAIKVLHPHLAAEAEVERRFRAEARHAARLKHPNIVVVLDQDDHHGMPFIVMELISGSTLREVLHDRGRMTPAEVVRLLAPVCAGLAAIHRTGLVHRDVKPENLLIDAAGTVRVADFGIARALDASQQTPAGTLLGSLRYMAPELVLGRPAVPASDQYALGVVVFEALTGQVPLGADDPAVVALRHAREVVPPPSSVGAPAVLDDVVATATSRRPEDRYPTMDAMLAAAREAVPDSPDTGFTAPQPAHRTRVHPAPYLPTARGPVPPAPAPARSAAPPEPHPPVHRQPDGPRPPAPARGTAPPEPHPPAPAPPRGTAPPEPHPPAPRKPAGSRPAARDLRPVGAISLLAIVAALLATFADVGGVLAGVLCGSIALRRIMRRNLRGGWIAQSAIVVAALRLLAYVAA